EEPTRASGEVDHPLRPRELEALLECRRADSCEVSRCDDRPGTEGEFSVAELFREREGALRECPLFRIGVWELATRRQRLEQRDRLSRGLRRVRRPTGAPEDVRQPGKRLALLQSLSERAPELDRLLNRLDRVVEVVGEVAGA